MPRYTVLVAVAASAPTPVASFARDTGTFFWISSGGPVETRVVDRMVAMRRGETIADDLSPKTSTIRDVEDIIAGERIAA